MGRTRSAARCQSRAWYADAASARRVESDLRPSATQLRTGPPHFTQARAEHGEDRPEQQDQSGRRPPIRFIPLFCLLEGCKRAQISMSLAVYASSMMNLKRASGSLPIRSLTVRSV